MSSHVTNFTFNAIAPTQVNRFVALTQPSTGKSPGAVVSVARNSDATSAPVPGNRVVHPEGSLIYWDANLVSCQLITDTHLSLCAQIISRGGDSIARAKFTVFVEIRDHSRADYYIIMHESKMVAWIDYQLPESFADATPAKHDHEYWIHMENFPGPFFASPQDRQNLVNVLASLAVDASTSDGSTSPMSVEQIDKDLRMLSSFGDEVDITQTYSIARLWNMILQSRVINKYGTPEARLDRFISVLDNPPQFKGGYETMNRFMFETPRAHLDRCARAWADRIAYTQEWRKFKARNEQEWQQVVLLASVLVIASLLAKSQSTCTFKFLSNIALLAALGSLAGGYYLLNESQNLDNHAADAVSAVPFSDSAGVSKPFFLVDLLPEP
ncbi:hypothetical protein FS749_015652 [Ceratobasidium sp. UAMH 11750]|nr:hypothetical protein FS749_015652 [Ceratobasidium sp. UAMH 11750]